MYQSTIDKKIKELKKKGLSDYFINKLIIEIIEKEGRERLERKKKPKKIKKLIPNKKIRIIKEKTKKNYIRILEGRDVVRERIRARDNYTCQKCKRVWNGKERRFDVHHLDAKKEKTKQYDNYEIEKDNMITLCHKCHMSLPVTRFSMSLYGRNLSYN